MKNLLLTFFLFFVASSLFAQVLVLDNFDEEPADTSYWLYANSENSTNSETIITYQSDIVNNGAQAMKLEWTAERAEGWGGFTKVEHWHPDPNGLYDFSSHDSISFWYYVDVPNSEGANSVHLRFQLFDASDSELPLQDGGDNVGAVTELYYSFEYVLASEPGWNEVVLNLDIADENGEPYWNDKGFTWTGWTPFAGNGKFDKDKIKGWSFEFSIDGTNDFSVANGSVIIDDLALKGVSPKTFVFFNGLSNPSTITEFFSWNGGAEIEEGAGADGVTNAVKWTQSSDWVGIIWGFEPIDMSLTWAIDTLKFKMKAEEGVGNTRIQWEDSVAVIQGNANEGRLGFNFDPIADGEWHDYAFPMTEYFTNYYDGSTAFDTSAVMRLHILAEGSGSGKVVYFDDMWLGTYEADLIAPEAPEGVAAIASDYANFVTWTDVPGEEGESYHIYYSENPITEITDMTDEVILGYAEGEQSYLHDLKYPVSDNNVTFYYAVVCEDAAGNRSTVSATASPTTNLARGVTTVHLGTPAGFAADGNLDDWAGITPFNLSIANGTANLAGDTKIHDGEADLSVNAYVAMDNENMYLGFDVQDDIISSPEISTWLRDSPDFFIGLYDWRGKSHTSYQKGAEPDFHFRFNVEEGFIDGDGGFLFTTDSADYSWDEVFLPTTGYVVEAKIPFTRLAEWAGSDVFVPVEGMRVKIDFAINDNDGGTEPARECILALSPRNEDLSWSDVSRWTYTWIGALATDVDEESTLPLRYELSQNYPNPFNPTTQISYSILNKSNVSLKIFNILGQEVKTLVNEVKAPGVYTVNFDASELSTGMYIYQVQAGSFVSSKKMLLIK